MVGKYKDLGETKKTTLPELNENICHKKVLDPNNSAYVDVNNDGEINMNVPEHK